MAEPQHEQGDPELHELFERFDGRLVSPGGAAQLLGVSRKTVYTLGKRDVLRVFHSSEKSRWSETGSSWTLIPLKDVAAYAERVGRPFPNV